MDADYHAEQELKTYKKVQAMRKVIIDDFLAELKDEMDIMKYSEDPRDGGQGVVCECEDRGYNMGISQIQEMIRRLRPK